MKADLPVALRKCDDYDVEKITELLALEAKDIGISPDEIRGKRVVIKPNLVLGYAPEKGATSHPAVIEAVISLLKKCEAGEIVIAERPGGPYNELTLTAIYRATGMSKFDGDGVILNGDFSSGDFRYPEGRVSKMFTVITPILESDVIINVSKRLVILFPSKKVDAIPEANKLKSNS